MKTIKKAAFQGDIFFLRVREIPPGLKATKHGKEGAIIGHSETGHHHVVETINPESFGLFIVDQMKMYLDLKEPADIVHKRPFDTHETLRLSPGKWEVRRQREWAPEGYRRVED